MGIKHRTKEQRHLQAVLRAIRKEGGYTQRELADRLGRPQSYVSKYESGERRLDLPEIEAICSAVEIELSVFVDRYSDR